MCCVLITQFGLAHSPKETHSELFIKNKQLHFKIEFPWSIGEAVKSEFEMSDEDLKEANFLEYLLKYIESNITVSQNHKVIPFENFQKLNGVHGHSSTLELIFPIDNLEGLEVENTLLFSSYKEQANHHIIRYPDGLKKKFTTSNGASSFHLDEKEESNIPIIALLIFICILFPVLVLYKTRNA